MEQGLPAFSLSFKFQLQRDSQKPTSRIMIRVEIFMHIDTDKLDRISDFLFQLQSLDSECLLV